ncbi:uncharacterized protein LOC131881545 [Tigriopus californicus]|uniref:uncharacterized protein LOC131881545 n=1 Tax=Tigriopus californicus TaxID=6832 RepID=UPI0027DA00C3|nr:uncharacterized protein LOC131881545 [Tigriopus californicus]
MSERVKNHLSRAHMHANVNPLEGDQPLNGPNDQDEGECEEAHLNQTEPKTEEKQPDTKPKGNDTPEGGYYEPGDQTPIWNPPSAAASDQAKGRVKPASESFGEFNIETSKSFLNKTHQNVEDAQPLLDRSKLQVKDMNALISPVESDPAMLIGQDFSSILNKVIHTLAKSTKGPVDVGQTPSPSSDPPPPPLPATDVLPGPSPPLSETPLNPLTDSNLTRVPSISNPHEAEAEVVNQCTSYLGANHSGRAAAEVGPSASSQLKYHSNSSEVIAPPPPPGNPRQAKDMRRPSGSISDVEINSFMNQWCHQPPAQPTTSTELVTPSASTHKEPVLSSALAKLRARKAQKKAAQAEVSSSTGGRSSPLGSDISECSNASGQNFLPGNQYSRQYPPPPIPPLPPLPPSAHYQHQHQPQQRQPYAPSYHSDVGNGWGGAQPPLPPIPPPPLSIPPSSSYLHPFPSHYQQPPLPPSQQIFRPR